MKKAILFTIFISVCSVSYAQNTFPSTGSVGIGTNTPLAPLDVKMATNQHVQFVPDLNGGYTGYSGLVCINDANSAYTPLGFWASKYFIGGGNVGIGTTSPAYKLDVDGQAQFKQNLFVKSNSSAVLIADPSNNVGIGTTDPAGYKLAVNGNIRAKEVKVETGWSDYVFYPAYKLRPLSEVATYIKTNQHLPDVPSVAEVEKNGINVGETNALLLKKIEELTLYLIEKDKQLVEIKQSSQTQIDELKKQLKQIKEEIRKN